MLLDQAGYGACRLFAALVVLGASFGPANAQDFPNQPIKVINGFPAGGLIDTMTRIVTEKMTPIVGQPFVIENRTGAGGTIATQAVARAAPDGYTIMMIPDNHALNPSVFKNLPYDSVKDFAPIGFVGIAPMALTVHASVPANTVKEFVELARQKPGTLTYASVGLGSASHLAGEIFADKAGIQMQHVPYRGGAPAVSDLIAGHVNALFLTPVLGLPHLQAGRVKVLAIAASERSPLLPEVPTMAEAGYPLEAAYWFGLIAPAGTPPAAIARLEKALAETLAQPDVRQRITAMGATVKPLGSQQFGEFIKVEIRKWSEVIAKHKIKPE